MSLLIAMCLFAFSMSISPGPVNLVTFSAGLNYGFLPSLPFEATPGNGLFVFAGLHLVICFFSVGIWAFAGARVSELPGNKLNLQWCNRAMGGLLIIVAFYLLYLQSQVS